LYQQASLGSHDALLGPHSKTSALLNHLGALREVKGFNRMSTVLGDAVHRREPAIGGAARRY